MCQIIALYRQGNTGNNFLRRLRQTYSGLLVSHILIKILLVPNLKKPGSHAEFSPTAYLQRRGRERAKDVEMVARKRLCVFLNFAHCSAHATFLGWKQIRSSSGIFQSGTFYIRPAGSGCPSSTDANRSSYRKRICGLLWGR